MIGDDGLRVLTEKEGGPPFLFLTEFRGDTVHPSTLKILDQIGLAEKVHEIPHSKIHGPSFITSKGLFQPFDLQRAPTGGPEPQKRIEKLSNSSLVVLG